MRPTVERKIKSFGSFAFTLLVGLALMVGGGFFLYIEMQETPPHTPHVMLFAGIALLGALVIRPDPIFTVVKQVVVIATPFIPTFGRRANSGEVSPPPPPKDGIL